MLKNCENCRELKEHHAKGLCLNCYKKLNWKPKISKCRRCLREIEIHAKGLCAGCYNYSFHLDKNKAYHHRKSNNVDLVTYKQVTSKCEVCDFDKIVDIHHLDRNKENNSPKNLVGLCPNHHRMIKSAKFKKEILEKLQNKGFWVPLDEKIIPKKEGYSLGQKKSLLEFR